LCKWNEQLVSIKGLIAELDRDVPPLIINASENETNLALFW